MEEKTLVQGNIGRSIIKVASPVAVNNLFYALYGLVDMLFVARIGPLELATVVFIQPLESLFVAISDGLAIGSTSLIAKEIGRGGTGQKIMNQLIFLGIALGSFAGALVFLGARQVLLWFTIDGSLLELATGYFRFLGINIVLLFLNGAYYGVKRAQGETVEITIINTISIIIKLVCLFMTIVVFDLKLTGLLMSTILGSLVITSYASYDLIVVKKLFSNKADAKIDLNIMKAILLIGFPIMIEKSSLSFGNILVNKYALAYGVSVLTAFGITNRINSVIFSFLTGFGTGVSILVAQNIGAKNYRRVQEAFSKSLQLALVVSLILVAGLLVFRTKVALLFANNDPQVLKHTINAITIYSASAIPWAGLQIIIGYFQGTGQTQLNLIISLARLYVFRVPLIFMLSHISALNEYSIWLGMLISNVLVTLFAALIYQRKRLNALNQKEAGVTSGLL